MSGGSPIGNSNSKGGQMQTGAQTTSQPYASANPQPPSMWDCLFGPPESDIEELARNDREVK